MCIIQKTNVFGYFIKLYLSENLNGNLLEDIFFSHEVLP